jgi:broad specificity phosphatase PhoE
MEILLVRHGESEGNTQEVDPQKNGDYCLNLTDKGKTQAEDEGIKIGADFIRNALIYSSPYYRTRQTLDGIIKGAGIQSRDELVIYEDPRLREVEHGFHGSAKDVQSQEDSFHEKHGKFYYRYKGGESPADCFDRVATFLESMQRQMERKEKDKVLIISHGLTIRCFIMRFLHLTVEEFDSMGNPYNCAQVRIAHIEDIKEECRLFSTRTWAVERYRSPKTPDCY